MTGLVEFLKARLDDDERAAREASPSPWKHPDEDESDALWLTREDAYHIYRWEPARVLTEVDAKRRQIELCEHMAGWTDEHNPRVSQHEMTSMRIAAEQMLLLVAAPYAEHPECRDEWRP